MSPAERRGEFGGAPPRPSTEPSAAGDRSLVPFVADQVFRGALLLQRTDVLAGEHEERVAVFIQKGECAIEVFLGMPSRHIDP